MKPRAKVTSILTKVLAILSILLLAGCVSTKQKFQDDMMAQGVKPLTASEVKALFSNATDSHGTSKHEAKVYYSADGKIQGKVKGSWGEDSDEGEWRVSEDGLLCTKYLGKWSKFGENCASVYPGKADSEYTLIQVSGSKSKNYPDGIIPIKVTPGM